jgi:purine nucleosidase
MAIALDPAICTESSDHFVDVEVHSELTRGMTVVDRLGVAGDARNREVWRGASAMKVCWALDVPAFKSALFAALG